MGDGVAVHPGTIIQNCSFGSYMIQYASTRVSAHTYLEELAHGLVVQAITAVEDHALDGQSLGQVLGGLCLACAGRAGWRSTQVHVNSPNQGAVAPVTFIAC